MEFPYGLGTVYKQHKGRCKCIEKQVHMWEGRVVSSREMDRVKSLELTKGHTATAKHRDLVTCYCMITACILSICFHMDPSFTEHFNPQRWIAA